MLSILLSSLCALSNWILITFTIVPSQQIIITGHHELFYHLRNVNSCMHDKKKQSNLSNVCYPNDQWLQGCSFVTTTCNHKYLLRSFYTRDVETLLIYEIKACIVWILMGKIYWHPVRGSVTVLVSHGTAGNYRIEGRTCRTWIRTISNSGPVVLFPAFTHLGSGALDLELVK